LTPADPENKITRSVGKFNQAFIIFRENISNKPHVWLVLILGLVTLLHFSLIMTPGEYVFDEKWYVEDALKILEGKGTFIPQHPPLGRLIIAGGIAMFGDNPFGWRIFPVLSGIAGLLVMYLVCRELRLPAKLSLLVVFLLATENLSFIQSSIAMLDVFSVTFMVAGFLAYLKGRHVASGALIGLSMLAKFTGIFALAVIGLHWLITSRKHWLKFAFSLTAAPVVYFAGLFALLWCIWGKLLNPFTETATMLKINSWSTFDVISTDMLSRPWHWLLGYEIITYWPEPHYMAVISSSIWALILPAMIYMLYKAGRASPAAVFSLAWFGGTYLLWIPVSLITDRTSYIFYFYPAIGACCIAITVFLWDISRRGMRSGTGWIRVLSPWTVPAFVLMHLLCFVYLSPVSYLWKLGAGIIFYIGARVMFRQTKDAAAAGEIGNS